MKMFLGILERQDDQERVVMCLSTEDSRYETACVYSNSRL
jgi:hypothetical protein